ncbi:hypothetical protein [uncultured Phycicoccus sp.]|uniref:hypothetical protein n=1 Tax=uncultured Phycicoccus sp. TaxID=661422 RepID=UPI0026388E87|nr:hypothetical protein [uncultured Phycicoccus sp.]
MTSDPLVHSPRRAWPRAALLAVVALGTVLVLGACAAGPNPALDTGTDPPGFWLGLWHGVIVPVTFIVSLFTDAVSVYAVRNSGNWYDAGFMLGLLISLGGAGGSSRGRR